MDVDIRHLPNGVTVVTDHMPHLQSAILGVWIGAGSRSESPQEHGIAHFLEHMAFKGTPNRTALDIAEQIENVGGEINAATSVENTSFYVRVLKDDVPLAIDILSDILQNSTFDEDEITKERNVILQEIGALQDSPEDKLFDIFQEVAYDGHPIGRPIMGTPQSVSAFEAKHLRAFLDNRYLGGEIVIAAAGAVEADAFCALVADAFSDIPAGDAVKPIKAAYQGGSFSEEHDLQEAQILLGFEGRSFGNTDYFAMQLMTAILGGGMSSRLFQEVREKRGLCYSVYAFHWGYSDTGLFGIHTATGEDSVSEVMPVVLGELVRISEDVSEAELARAKAQLKAGLLMGLESPAMRASQLARHILLFGNIIHPDTLKASIEAVQVSDIRALARAVFFGTEPTLTAIGPVKGLLSVDDVKAHLKSNMMAVEATVN